MSQEVVDGLRRQSFKWRDTASRYFVLNAITASAFHLPDPQEPILHQALLGLIPSPRGGGHYMAAELQPIIGCDEATLLCFSSEVGEWVDKSIHTRPLAPICVISHHGRLWGVDLTWGVITSDPFADEPVQGAAVQGNLGSDRPVPVRWRQRWQAAIRGHVHPYSRRRSSEGERVDAGRSGLRGGDAGARGEVRRHLGRLELQGDWSVEEDPRACAHPPQEPQRGVLLPGGAPVRCRRARPQGCGLRGLQAGCAAELLHRRPLHSRSPQVTLKPDHPGDLLRRVAG